MLNQLVLSDAIAGPTLAGRPGFRCTMRHSSLDAAWIHVAGELDMASAPCLTDALNQAALRAQRIVLDLREVTFMDSSGVHAIVSASRRDRLAGGRLVIVRGPPQVDRLFEVTAVPETVEMVDLDPDEPPVQALVKLAHDDAE